MAENCTRAFGRYLKTLRDRRGLSLYDVCSLSQTFPDPLNKGYLSRCENGHQKLAFAKLIPLSRIYEVPANVLVERMELDMELERVGSLEPTEGSFTEATATGKRLLDDGYRWNAYGLFRDAINLAAVDPVVPPYRDASEQVACAQMNCGTAAVSLGKFRYALHEFLFLEASGAFGPRYSAVILERISTCYRGLDRLDDAVKYSDAAIARAEGSESCSFLGYLYGNRARVSFDQHDFSLAAEYFQKAFRAYRKADLKAESARTLNSLAQCYFDLNRHRAARRALIASQSISEPLNHHLVRAHSQLLLGEIDELERRPGEAAKRWKSVVGTAKMLRNKQLRFQAEYLLFRSALSNGNEAVARSIRRRLIRLAPRVPPQLAELLEFKRIVDRVSPAQHGGLSANN